MKKSPEKYFPRQRSLIMMLSFLFAFSFGYWFKLDEWNMEFSIIVARLLESYSRLINS